jgi:hypothetical protein
MRTAGPMIGVAAAAIGSAYTGLKGVAGEGASKSPGCCLRSTR